MRHREGERESERETCRWQSDWTYKCKSSVWWNVDGFCLFTWEFFPLPSINNYSLSQGPAIIAPLNDKLLHSPGLSTNSLIDRGCADISSSDVLWMPLCIIHRSVFTVQGIVNECLHSSDRGLFFFPPMIKQKTIESFNQFFVWFGIVIWAYEIELTGSGETELSSFRGAIVESDGFKAQLKRH